ncbi:Hypothetical predicted protein [Cloeon dipterum]|uniref:Uncharacterized protein n=1 Tax=Cloeon dipterum TaxID=197152 RepID=A0A8S1DIH9_9INSE|nr:Hypothetical predicted protein [Cloeon dipterum]
MAWTRPVRYLVFCLVACGICPPKAYFGRLPKWIDHLNLLIRFCIVACYVALEISSPTGIKDFSTSNTILAALHLTRISLVAHQVLAWLQSRNFGQFVSEVLPRVKLNSILRIIPSILYLGLLPFKLFIGRNPFTSLKNTPLLFSYIALSGCVAAIALATAVVEYCHQELRLLNDKLEQQTVEKSMDLEFILARIAKKGVELSALIESSNRGIGPLVAITVLTLCMRLSFTTYCTYYLFSLIVSNGIEDHSIGTLFSLIPRSLLKVAILTTFANAGERLNNEAAKTSHLLDLISVSNRLFPSIVCFQIAKCRSVFDKSKISISGWGLMNVDHTLLITMFNIVFGTVMVLVQLQVSETVSSKSPEV